MHISTTSPHDILDLLRSREEIAIAADPALLAETLDEIDRDPIFAETRAGTRAVYLRLAALLRASRMQEPSQWLVSTGDEHDLRLCMIFAAARSGLDDSGDFDAGEFLQRVLRVCRLEGRA